MNDEIGRAAARSSARSATPGCAACTCSPGAISTTRTRADPRCTPTTSCGDGRRPASRSSTAHRPGSGSRRRLAATATTSCAAGAGTRSSRAPSSPSSPAGWAASTVSSRSGTACRGSRRSGAAGHGSRSSTTCTARCGTRSCPRPLAGLGRALETRVAPPFYRRTEVVTPSGSTRDELLAIGFVPERVTAVDNGVEPFFTPGERRYDDPTIVATARLAPVKRFGLLIEAAAAARASDPRSAGEDHRGGTRTRRPRGLDPTPRRRIVGHARRLRAARPAGERVPAGVDRRQRVDRRGLGARPHRGRGVRHACCRDRHPRAPLVGHRRRDRSPRPARSARRSVRRRAGRSGAPRAARRRRPAPRAHADVGRVGAGRARASSTASSTGDRPAARARLR